MLHNHVLIILAFEASMFIWAWLRHLAVKQWFRGDGLKWDLFTALGGRCSSSQFVRVWIVGSELCRDGGVSVSYHSTTHYNLSWVVFWFGCWGEGIVFRGDTGVIIASKEAGVRNVHVGYWSLLGGWTPDQSSKWKQNRRNVGIRPPKIGVKPPNSGESSPW